MYEHNALGYCSGLALCLTKVRSSRARCPATALIDTVIHYISIIVIKVKTELQLFSVILKTVIKLQLITITILITPTLSVSLFIVHIYRLIEVGTWVVHLKHFLDVMIS